MSAVTKCDRCESHYAMERADFPYPLTVTDTFGGTADYCSAECVAFALLDLERRQAFKDGTRSATPAAPKRRWFR